jgi:uncharacterized protein YuzE
MEAMKVQFDRRANAAYLSLRHPLADGEAVVTHVCDPLPRQVKGMVHLDFDARGRLVGIEVINATRVLPQVVLDQAERIS